MNVALDTSVLSYLFFPDTEDPVDRDTKEPIKDVRKRIIGVVDSVTANQGVVLVPTPALAEVLVYVEPDLKKPLLQKFSDNKDFRPIVFDQAAAVETAAGIGLSLARRRANAPNADMDVKRKIKYDHMIIGTAKSAGAAAIYTADKAMARYAEMVDMPCIHVRNVPVPEYSRSFDFGR